MTRHRDALLRATLLTSIVALSSALFSFPACGQTTGSVGGLSARQTSSDRAGISRFSGDFDDDNGDFEGEDESLRPDPDCVLRWKAVLTLAGNHTDPSGDFYEGIVSGSGFETRLAVAVGPRTALRLSYIRTGIHVEDDLGLYVLTDQSDIVIPDPEVEARLYTIGLQGYHYLDPHSNSGTLGYFYLEAGWSTHTVTGTVYEVDIGSPAMTFLGIIDESDTDFTLGTGIGLIFPVGDKF